MFNRYYQEWKKETHISFHSNTNWFISRQSFRKIVGLGMDVIPLLENKIKDDKRNNWKNGDYFLAFAVVEIYGWNKTDFHAAKIAGEQDFCDKVLQRLEKIKSRNKT